MEELEPEMEQLLVPVVVIKDECSPVRRVEVQPALAALDELSDLELSKALRGYTAKQQAKWMWNSTDAQTYIKEHELIRLVRKQPALYNRRHWQFDDDTHKERVWQSIANELRQQMCQCMNSWAELRYRYQQHVRRLRVFRRKSQQGRRQLKRPSMLHEEDLLFLFPHVARQPLLREEEEAPEDNDDVTILPPQPAAIIDVDADYAEEQLQLFNLSAEQERLIEAVQPYPHLYDSQHPSYANYRHRGLIWVAISNELHAQATKLMKMWLQLQTRYEWQILHGGTLCPALQFLAPHVLQKKQTVCKMSLFLQDAWHDPIENFRGVMQLINVLKTMPELAQLVEEYEYSKQKPPRYAGLWQCVATQINASAERCEVTWLILRNFYLELHEMRKAGYQLQDKWFFEKIIAGFYKLLAARSKCRARKRLHLSSSSSTSTTVAQPPAKRLAVEISNVTTSTSDACSSKSSGCTSSVACSSINITSSVVSKASIASLITTSSAIRGSTTQSTSCGNISASSLASAIPHSNSGAVIAELSSLTPRILPKLLPAPMPAYSTSSSTLSRLSKPPTLKPMTNVARAVQQVPPALSSARGEGGGVATVVATGQAVGVAGATAEVAGAGVREKAAAEAVVGAGGAEVVPGVEAEGRPEVCTGVRVVAGAGAAAVGGVRVVEVKAVVTAGGGAGVEAGVRADVRAGAVVNSKLPTLKPALAIATAPSKPKTTPAVPKLLPLRKLLPMPNLVPLSTQLTLPKPLPLSPPHDIKVEFLEDAPEGRQLRIAGGSLLQPSVLEMSQVILFVREVLAIPQLHSKEASLQAKIDKLWPQISKKYKMPENVCRALFSYLAGNLSVLPRIASVTELMCPLRSNLKVWEKSQRLFSKFNESARKYDWVKPQLQELLQHFQRYEHLYWKLRRPQPDDRAGPLQPPRHYTKEEKAEVWRVAQERFPHMNHQDIWSLFKCTFRTYMEDLERGVENPWPQHWWHALQQLKFLIDVRYHRLDPYYYIVHNKFVAQVRRCSMYERLMQSEKGAEQIERSVQLTPWELEEEEMQIKKETKQGEKVADEQQEQAMQREKELVKEKEQAKELEEQANRLQPNRITVKTPCKKPQEEVQQEEQKKKGQKEQNEEQDVDKEGEHEKQQKKVHEEEQEENSQVQQANEKEQTESVLICTLQEAADEQELLAHLEPLMELLPETVLKSDPNLPTVEPYQVTRMLRCHPASYGKADTLTKRQAWVQVAKELNTTVTECRLSLQHALREQRLLQMTDPKRSCKFTKKYYHHMSKIYQHVKEGGELNEGSSSASEIRHQLQQEATASPIIPENFIPDINFSTCSPSLVLKNWAFAACRMPMDVQRQHFRPRLKEIFARYEKLANSNNCPQDDAELSSEAESP